MKKKIRIVLSILVTLWLLIQILPVPIVTETNPFAKGSDGRPLIIAHGGAKDLFPENTMVAFDGAMAIGVDMLEIDVCLTKDDVLITQHDLTIDAVTDGTGLVRDYTYDDLLAYNFGDGFTDLNGNKPYADEHVQATRLEDVLIKYPDMLFNIELKDQENDGLLAANILYEMIVRHDLEDQVLVPSFSDANIQQFRRVSNGSILTSSASGETADFIYFYLAGLDKLVRELPYESMQLPLSESGIPLDTRRLIRRAQQRNIAVHYWTIDDPKVMADLIEKGVDGIITDRPDLMHEVLEEMGYYGSTD